MPELIALGIVALAFAAIYMRPRSRVWQIRIRWLVMIVVALVLLVLPVSALIAVKIGKADPSAFIASVVVTAMGYFGIVFGI